MPEHRIHVTVSEHGFEPENGERFLAGFMATHPDVGPSVSQNTETGTLSVTFSLDAEDASEALDLGRTAFCEGAAESGLPVTRVVALEATFVAEAEYEEAEAPEPVLA